MGGGLWGSTIKERKCSLRIGRKSEKFLLSVKMTEKTWIENHGCVAIHLNQLL